MTDELFYARRKQLTEAVKKAVLELWAHENIQPESVSIELDDGQIVTVRVSKPKADG